MEHNIPKVTVLMPAFNAGRYIGEAIRSVLEQSFQDFELLIINDGSTDNTAEIIASFNDPRITAHDQEHKGISTSLNNGLLAAKGRYIARFDADDICFPNRLAVQTAFLDDNTDYILVGSDAAYIQEDGLHLFDFSCRAHESDEIMHSLHTGCPFIHSSVMYRKDKVLQVGGYSIHAHNFEDHLLWVNLVRTGKCHNIPQPLIKVRFNPVSVTIDEKWRGRAFRELKQAVLKRGSITEAEGERLLKIIRSQRTIKIQQASYHALCSKKFLLENYQPAKARWHAGKSIRIHPTRVDNYTLLAASYLPQKWICWLSGKSNKIN